MGWHSRFCFYGDVNAEENEVRISGGLAESL